MHCWLENKGWIAHEADTVALGLSEASTRRPDLVILDLGLPDADGINFLRDLRGWSDVAVIVLSARRRSVNNEDLPSTFEFGNVSIDMSLRTIQKDGLDIGETHIM